MSIQNDLYPLVRRYGKFVPPVLVGALLVMGVAGAWAYNIKQSSFATGEGEYEIKLPAIAPQYPKDSYLCTQQGVWSGCKIAQDAPDANLKAAGAQ